MNLKERIELYKKIEEKRGKPLVVYTTSQRAGAHGQMASDVINEFITQLERIESNDEIDVLVISTGGDPLTSWRLISLLRTNFSKVNVLVPESAFSAATLFALGADEIVMGRYGCLGPIDPQIESRQKDGSPQKFGYEDVASFLDFVREEGGITEQKHIESALNKLCEVVSPTTLGFAKRSSSLSISMGEKMLQTHMSQSEERQQAQIIAKKLNKSFFSHGHAISRGEAKEIGLNIIEPDEELEKLLWDVNLSFQTEFETRKPFDPLAAYLNDPKAAPLLKSPSPVILPPQINQQIALQLLQSYIDAQVNVQLPEIEIQLKTAVVESVRFSSEHKSKVRILVQRTLDMKFNWNLVVLEQGWQDVIIEASKEE